MLNVVATLQQRCGNVDVGTTLIFDRATTLWQRQQRRCDNVVTTSLCQLGIGELLRRLKLVEFFTYHETLQKRLK